MPPGCCNINLSRAAVANQQGDEEWINGDGGLGWNKPCCMCWRVKMHFYNSDKLDLTANHRQQWLRTLRAVVCPTQKRGSAKTSVCVCVPWSLNNLVWSKVWNRSDRKHLLFPAVTCYPFSWGESGEPLFPAAGGCQRRLDPEQAPPGRLWASTCYTCYSGPTGATKTKRYGVLTMLIN